MNEDTIETIIAMFIASALFFVLFYIIAWIFCVKIMKIPAEEDAGIYMILFTTVNNRFIGFPVTYGILGDEILFFMVIFQVMLIAYVYSAGVIQVNYGGPKVSDLRGIIKALMNICTISTFVSIIMLFLGIHLHALVFNTLEQVGSATTPVSMLVIGMQLGSSNYK